METLPSVMKLLIKTGGVAMLVMLCVLLSKSTYLLIKSIRATKWPKAKAKIIISGVDVEYSTDGDKCEPYVEYTYIVDNTEFVSNCFAFFSKEITFRMIAKRAVKKFPRGGVTLVSYNPGNLGESVLLVGITWLHVPQLIYMSLLLFIVFKFWLS